MTVDQHPEPTAEELALAHEAFELSLISFSRVLETLEPTDSLPRYNRLTFKMRCRAPYDRRPLFLTVRRHGSNIRDNNFYTVPFFPAGLSVGDEAVYELLSFDSFNLRFESMSVEKERRAADLSSLQQRNRGGQNQRVRQRKAHHHIRSLVYMCPHCRKILGIGASE